MTANAYREPLVELRGVRRVYGTGETALAALDDIYLSVSPGDRLAVVGPSGSGKTTLLSVCGLIDRPDAGEVFIAGERVTRAKEERRADLRRDNIGFVFQAFHLVPALDALDNVVLPLLPYRPIGDLRKKAGQLLVRLGLRERTSHRPAELSGGEQQRVAIARALINDPQLVLADEPTGNLDTKTSRQVLELLKSLQQELGFALVVATHDAKVASAMHRRLSLLDGCVVARKVPTRTRPANGRVKRTAGSDDRIDPPRPSPANVT